MTLIWKVVLAAGFLVVASYYVANAWSEIKEAVAIARYSSDDDTKP